MKALLTDHPRASDHSPSTKAPPAVQPVRALFVSDVHLGAKHSQAAALVEMLYCYQPGYLYIVGDFIDGWKLKRRWRWKPAYDRLLQRLLELKRSGTKLFYAPGNHDNFLRHYLADFGVIDIRDRFIHTAADGRQYLVMHGDQFDRVEQEHQWISIVGTYAYDLLLSANYGLNWARRKRHNRYAMCGKLKRRVKGLVTRASNYKQKFVEAAADENCFGIICGHIHSPKIQLLGELAYLNTGDWVENGTALIEADDGSFTLLTSDGEILAQLPAASPQ